MTFGTAPARRGRRPAGEDTRTRIEEAARSEFAERGYDATSLRSVARAAGVDPALVHHYFEGKADLFARAVVMTRVNPAAIVDRVLDGPVDTLGERLVRAFLMVWDEPSNQERLVAVLRAAQTNDEVGAMLTQFASREIVGRMTRRTGAADPALRGGLVASQVLGLVTTRYLLAMEPMASASHDDIARWVGPTLQRYLVGTDASRP